MQILPWNFSGDGYFESDSLRGEVEQVKFFRGNPYSESSSR